MLRLWINFAELCEGHIAYLGNKWSFPGGEIVPYEHPLLESRLYECERSWLFVLRERRQGHALPPGPRLAEEERAALQRELATWPLDWLTFAIQHQTKQVILEVGALGTAPLYAATYDQWFVASWDLNDHLDMLSLADVDCARLAHFLVGTGPYAPGTIFEPVKFVTERSRVTARVRSLHVELPASAPYYSPCELKPDADVPRAFAHLLRQTLGLWPLSDNEVLSELSGGLDSALVSAVLAKTRRRTLRTYALRVEGAAQSQQCKRRALLQQHFGFTDVLHGTEHMSVIPMTLEPRDEYIAAPFNADFQLPLRKLFRRLGCFGGESIATGTGGDELVMPHHFELTPAQQSERSQFAFMPGSLFEAFAPSVGELLADVARHLDELPFSQVPYSCLQAHAARAPLFLSEGLWPVSPLSHPACVKFARSLPIEWRSGKRLQRATLEHLGVEAAFFEQPLRENFIPLLLRSFQESKRRILAQAKHGLVLETLGLVSVSGFVRMVQKINGPDDILRLSAFYNIYNLERILRRLPAKHTQHESRPGSTTVFETPTESARSINGAGA